MSDNVNINVLKLRPRTHNVLISHKINTINELKKTKDKDLISLKGLGKFALMEIKDQLLSYEMNNHYKENEKQKDETEKCESYLKIDESYIPEDKKEEKKELIGINEDNFLALIEQIIDKKIKQNISIIKKHNGYISEELNKIKTFVLANSKINEDNFKQFLNKSVVDIFESLQKSFDSSVFNQVNELRTLVLEQSRILEGFQVKLSTDPIIDKISKKIPGFDKIVYDLYSKLDNI